MANQNNTLCSNIDDFRSNVYPQSYFVITIFGLAGNGFALFVLIRTFRQSSAFHIYMMNLSAADLLCVCTLPLRVLYYVNNSEWIYGDFLCRISSYALYVNLYCSIYFMMAMSFTRFLAIVFPVQNRQLGTERRARIVCVCIWVFICTLCSPFLARGEYLDKETNKTKCFEPPVDDSDKTKLVVLNYLSLVVGFIVPFLVILFCYAGIIWVLLRNANTRKKQRTKAIRMIVVVMLAFLISFLPYHVQRTIHLHKQNEASCLKVYLQKSVVITLCLAAASSCFNPMLYFFSGENFRNRLSTIVKSSFRTHSYRDSYSRTNRSQTIQINRVGNNIDDATFS